jgi:hypothetical protein
MSWTFILIQMLNALPNVALQPRRFMIAPIANGCKRLLGGMSDGNLLRSYSPPGEVVFPTRSD